MKKVILCSFLIVVFRPHDSLVFLLSFFLFGSVRQKFCELFFFSAVYCCKYTTSRFHLTIYGTFKMTKSRMTTKHIHSVMFHQKQNSTVKIRQKVLFFCSPHHSLHIWFLSWFKFFFYFGRQDNRKSHAYVHVVILHFFFIAYVTSHLVSSAPLILRTPQQIQQKSKWMNNVFQ